MMMRKSKTMKKRMMMTRTTRRTRRRMAMAREVKVTVPTTSQGAGELLRRAVMSSNPMGKPTIAAPALDEESRTGVAPLLQTPPCRP